MKVQAIIPTAGQGTRIGGPTLKSLIELKGKPLFVHTLETFERTDSVTSVILVVEKDHLEVFENMVNAYGLSKVVKIVIGGQTRCDSVFNGLNALDDDTDIVIVHDGARPLVSKELIDECVKECETHGAIIAAVPVKPTIKEVDPDTFEVVKTLDRSCLFEVQTPQVFQKEVILKAHQERKDKNPTDDAVLVEAIGVMVKVVEGDYENIKVTTPEDITIAEGLLK